MHNVENGLAAVACAAGAWACCRPRPRPRRSDEFAGVRRRMELRGEAGGIRVYDDFAHHPTAIALTIDGAAAAAGRRRASSRCSSRVRTRCDSACIATELPKALAGADRVWLYQPAGLDWNLDGVAAAARREGCGRDANCPRSSRRSAQDLRCRRSRADHEQWRIRRPAREARCSALRARMPVNAEVRELPLFPLNAVLFPGGPLPLRIFEPRYLDMVSRCMREQSGLRRRAARGGRGSESATSFAATGTRGANRRLRPARGRPAWHQLHRARARADRRGVARGGRAESWPRARYRRPIRWSPVPVDQAWLKEVVMQVLPEAGDTVSPRGAARRRGLDRQIASRNAATVARRQAVLLELTDPLERLAALEPAVTRRLGVVWTRASQPSATTRTQGSAAGPTRRPASPCRRRDRRSGTTRPHPRRCGDTVVVLMTATQPMCRPMPAAIAPVRAGRGEKNADHKRVTNESAIGSGSAKRANATPSSAEAAVPADLVGRYAHAREEMDRANRGWPSRRPRTRIPIRATRRGTSGRGKRFPRRSRPAAPRCSRSRYLRGQHRRVEPGSQRADAERERLRSTSAAWSRARSRSPAPVWRRNCGRGSP